MKFEICGRKAVVLTRIDRNPSLCECRGIKVDNVRAAGCRCDDLYDRYVERFRKFIVPFIMSRHCHDGPSAVADQNIVSDPDGDSIAIDRIDRIATCKDSRFLFREIRAVEIALHRRLPPVFIYRRALIAARDPIHKWMLGCEHHVGHAEQRVGACRVDTDEVCIRSRGKSAFVPNCLLALDCVRTLPCPFSPASGEKVAEGRVRGLACGATLIG